MKRRSTRKSGVLKADPAQSECGAKVSVQVPETGQLASCLPACPPPLAAVSRAWRQLCCRLRPCHFGGRGSKLTNPLE